MQLIDTQLIKMQYMKTQLMNMEHIVCYYNVLS